MRRRHVVGIAGFAAALQGDRCLIACYQKQRRTLADVDAAAVYAHGIAWLGADRFKRTEATDSEPTQRIGATGEDCVT